MAGVNGIHHITAIAGDPQRNIDFYTGVLGLRLVKQTVNQDDPGTYHLYYGDELGRPGTILTFFPWVNAAAGRQGAGQAVAVALAITPASLGYWMDRLIAHGLEPEGPSTRFEERVLSFRDPDGLRLELVASPVVESMPGWDGGPVPAEHAIRGFHSTTLWLPGLEATRRVLQEVLGFTPEGSEENRHRFRSGTGLAEWVDLVDAAGFWPARSGAGTVHHVAWRVADEAAQRLVRQAVQAAGLHATEVIDRYYFRSVYFREPGGVLFELATDGPGFAVDEPVASLGSRLALPPFLESRRAELERSLPPIHLPAGAGGAAG